jgi:hypothetical protein
MIRGLARLVFQKRFAGPLNSFFCMSRRRQPSAAEIDLEPNSQRPLLPIRTGQWQPPGSGRNTEASDFDQMVIEVGFHTADLPIGGEARAMATSEKRNTAERHFANATKTVQRPERARTEQEEENRTIGEKTARLRSLRLARDAADKESAQGQAKKAANPKRANPVPKPNHRPR